MATSKRFKKASEGVDVNKSYTVEEAVKLRGRFTLSLAVARSRFIVTFFVAEGLDG